MTGGTTGTRMTPKRQAFAREYLIDFNASAAARRAGFSDRSAKVTASRLLTDPAMQVHLSELIRARAERVDRSGDDVVAALWLVADRCMQAVPVVDQATGKQAGEWRFNAAGANKALELLGRHLGLWNDKLSLQLTESKAKEFLEKAAVIIVRHVKDPKILAAIREDLAILSVTERD